MRRTALLSCILLVGACAHCGDSSPGSRPADAQIGDGAASDGALTDGAWGDATGPSADASQGTTPDAGTEDAMVNVSSPDAAALPARTYVYVGGYENTGLRVFELDRAKLTLRPIAHSADPGPSPTYICPSADGRHLYLANEANGKPGVTVLRVDPQSGVPSRVNAADDISGHGYVFTSLDPSGKFLLAASYNGANVGVYRVQADGAVGERVDSVQFAAGAQSHSVRVHPMGKWAFVPNKGLDSVAQLSFDGNSGALDQGAVPAFTRAGFDGPRHIAFSPDGRLAFVIMELANQLSSFAVQAQGTLRELDTKPRLPAGYVGQDTGAHVLAHPSLAVVYGSNRGSNTIAVFAYDPEGTLQLLEHVSTRGETPRNFDIDPHGQFLVVANQGGGGSLSLFSIGADGRLTAQGAPLTGLGQPAAVSVVTF